MIRGYVERRFDHLSESQRHLFKDYMYHIASQPGSGEYAVSSLLHPGAWAKSPLNKRLPSFNIPITFMYGVEDWMDYKAALATAPSIKAATRVIRLADAGHHLYSDNAKGFDEILLGELVVGGSSSSEVIMSGTVVGDAEYVYSK